MRAPPHATCYNVIIITGEMLMWPWPTLLYNTTTTTRETDMDGMEEKAEGGNKCTHGWMDRVCIQAIWYGNFRGTLSDTECERKRWKCWIFGEQSLTQQQSIQKNDEKCKCVCVRPTCRKNKWPKERQV